MYYGHFWANFSSSYRAYFARPSLMTVDAKETRVAANVFCFTRKIDWWQWRQWRRLNKAIYFCTAWGSRGGGGRGEWRTRKIRRSVFSYGQKRGRNTRLLLFFFRQNGMAATATKTDR